MGQGITAFSPQFRSSLGGECEVTTAFLPAEFCSSFGDEGRASAVLAAAFSPEVRFSIGDECEAPTAFFPAGFCSSFGDECKASAVSDFFPCSLARSFFSRFRSC